MTGTIWQKILEFIQSLQEIELFKFSFSRKPERSIAFTIAVIALSAKMAKADGRVDVSEISAFREIFLIRPEDEESVARFYNLARTSTVGFEAYAKQVADMFWDTPIILKDLLEGLFFIAASDQKLHETELQFLQTVAEIFGINTDVFNRLKGQYDPDMERNPYLVLNVKPDASDAELKKAWKNLLYELHPDHLLARGLPKEAVGLANHRLRVVNEAYAEIKSQRALA